MKRKSYLVVGAGRSGIAVAQLLLYHGHQVDLYDDQCDKQINFTNNNLTTYFGTNFIFNKIYTALVISPGVSLEHIIIKQAQAHNITIMSEIDCAYEYLPPEIIIIGVTGTNGKSTTTVMIDHILRSAGLRSCAGGNLGVPLSEIALRNSYNNFFDYLVLELSSFQLENTSKLLLHTGILLNITPDHLDRYNNFESYAQAKLNIFNIIKKSGRAIINSNLNYYINSYINNKNLDINYLDAKYYNKIKVNNLAGSHNLENALAAYITCRNLNISEDVILKSLGTYEPLPHRCELVSIKNNISYINDSKGTTVVAVTKALSLTKAPVHLLLGGIAKGEDFSVLSKHNFPNIAGYYIFGQAQQEISAALNTNLAQAHNNLREAFSAAQQAAKAGDAILLSPGCASYDQFTDFTERGHLFRKLVESL